MAYLNNIPQPTNKLSKSQSDLLNNFAAVSTLINVNHVGFNTSDQGKHKFVTYPVQGSAPSTLSTELVVWNQVSTLTDQIELFMKRGDTDITIPTTANNQSTNGWTYLPSGTLIKWGVVAVPASPGTAVITFPVSASDPVFNNVFIILSSASVVDVGGSTANSTIIQNTQTTTGFSVSVISTSSAPNVFVTYLAIGN